MSRVHGAAEVARLLRTVEGGHDRTIESTETTCDEIGVRFIELDSLRIGLSRSRRPEQVSVTRHAMSDFVVQFILDGEVNAVIDGKEHILRHGDAMIIPPGCSFRRTARCHETLAVVITAMAIRTRLAASISTPVRKPLIFETNIASAARPLLAMIRTIDQTLATGLASVGDPCITALERAFIDMLLEVQPHNYSAILTRDDRSVKHLRIEAIQALVDQDPSARLTAADLAAAAECSVRTLQANCVEYGMTNPMELVRRRRLALARERLLDRNCKEPLAGLAMRHGYSSPSRFASDYRQVYGETPSQTRRG